MDATAHLVAGAAVGMRRGATAALVAGILSNAVLDAIPHANYTGWRPFSPVMIVDGVLGLLLVAVIVRLAPHPWSAVAGALGAILPEMERILTGHEKDFLARSPLHLPQHEIAPPWGIMTQFAVVATSLLLATRTSHNARRHTDPQGAR